MAKNVIEKSFEVAGSHRVANQHLDFGMCPNNLKRQKCRSYHGHTGVYIIRLAGDNLVNDMVLDFNMIGFVKDLLDEYVDHRFMIFRDDPLFGYLVENAYKLLTGSDLKTKTIDDFSVGGYVVERVDIPDDVDRNNPLVELLESFTITSFNSTSEQIAKWMYTVVDHKIQHHKNTINWLPDDLCVDSVSYKESPKSCATYRP